ncbi:RNA-binding domain-containing protein, partial [Mycena rebaudengoi]
VSLEPISQRHHKLSVSFVRFEPLIRCDVPAPQNPHAQSNPYAFVEFRSQRDAEDTYYDMHGKDFDGSRLSIQRAKNPPSSVWRYERGPPRSSRDRDRSRSPRRRSDRDDRDKNHRGERRRRSRSPVERRRSRTPERWRSASPERRRDDRARTPPPTEEPPKTQDDRAQTPPFEN